MKITNKQYAQVLYELTQKRNNDDVDVALRKFVEILKKRRQLNLLENIIENFSEIWDKEHGVVKAKIISWEKLSEDLKNEIEKFIKGKYQARKVILECKIDKNIKGGIIIKVGDEILDGSINRKLNELKKVMMK